MGRWLGRDKASDYWDVFEDLSVVAAVEEVRQKNDLNFVWVYDSACKVATKRWKLSGPPHACDECYITRNNMKRAGPEGRSVEGLTVGPFRQGSIPQSGERPR